MKKMTWIVLLLLTMGSGLACPDKEEPKKPGREKPSDEAKAAKPAAPTQPSTRPKEYIEATEIFEKLIKPPRPTLVPPKTARGRGSDAPAPPTPPGSPGQTGPAGPEGQAGKVEDQPPKPAKDAPAPKGPEAPPAAKDAPATKPATPPLKPPPERPRFLPAQRKTQSGYVDWSRGRIVAAGHGQSKYKGARGKLMALRAARVIARRNALLIAAGVEIGADGRVRRPAAGTIEAKGTVRGDKTLKEKFDEQTGTATVTIEVPMYGVQGAVRADGRKIRVQGKRWKWVIKDPVQGESDLIVIDARRTDFEPILSPRLVNESGQIVFDPADQAERLGERHAFVHVEYSGSGPLVYHGAFRSVILLKPARAEKGSLVLTEQDMTALMRHLDARELLRAGRAVIVVRPKQPASSP